MREALYTLADTAHSLQRERGCSSIFLYSKGKLFNDRLFSQYYNSDKAIQSLQEGLEHWTANKNFNAEATQKLSTLLALCQNLPRWRDQVTKRAVSVSDCICHYSHRLIGPVLQEIVEIALNMEMSNPTSVSAYNAFLHWKERIGLERAIGARGFVSDSFRSEEFVERVLFLLCEQENYQNTFLALANETQQNLVENALKCDEIGQLNQIHIVLKKSSKDHSLYNMSPESWFDLISSKIDALHSVEKGMIDSLTKENLPTEGDDAVTRNSPHSIFGGYENLIRSHRLFSSITIENLNTLLRNSQIRNFNKGTLLFLEGEPANRLYVILKGWVKIFKGTVNGEETILQMLRGGDAIMDLTVFLNTSFPVSCQLVTDATLLSVPAPFLREQIKKNNELALNLMIAMSYRSQELLRQIGEARLKTADERVGRFLLKLLLEQDRISNCVELPYGKSLIAAHLGMKRETFSRVLGNMKDRGFRIKNNTVVLPELHALCSFCDLHIAKKCSHQFNANCPNPGNSDV